MNDDKLRGVSVHYPASGSEIMARLSHAEIAGRIRGWWKFHTAPKPNGRGWSDIGYQIAIDGAGGVWDLRGIGRIPAATASPANPDSNEEWGAVLFIIGDHETPTPEAIEAFNDWRESKWLKKWSRATRVIGHGDVEGASTQCPGLWLREATRSELIIDPESDLEGDFEMADLTQHTVGRDKDGTATHMGEMAARINHLYGEAVDGDGTPSATSRILAAIDTLGKRLEAVEKAVGK